MTKQTPKRVAQSKPESKEQLTIKNRLHDLCHVKKNEFSRSFYTHFHKRHLIAFAEFIDNPFCFNNGLLPLYQCQSIVKPLQKRQRVTLVKVVAALFARMEVETYQVGFCNNKDFMDTVAHTYKDETDKRESIRDIYQKMWGESICEKRYFAAINHLKLADFYCSDSIYLYTPEMEKERPAKCDDEPPIVKSHASYKAFTHRFFLVFNLTDQEDVKKSRSKSIAARIKNGWTTAWVSYQAFSQSFYALFWSKRKEAKIQRGEYDKYPQRKLPDHQAYIDSPLPEHWVTH